MPPQEGPEVVTTEAQGPVQRMSEKSASLSVLFTTMPWTLYPTRTFRTVMRDISPSVDLRRLQ